MPESNEMVPATAAQKAQYAGSAPPGKELCYISADGTMQWCSKPNGSVGTSAGVPAAPSTTFASIFASPISRVQAIAAGGVSAGKPKTDTSAFDLLAQGGNSWLPSTINPLKATGVVSRGVNAAGRYAAPPSPDILDSVIGAISSVFSSAKSASVLPGAETDFWSTQAAMTVGKPGRSSKQDKELDEMYQRELNSLKSSGATPYAIMSLNRNYSESVQRMKGQPITTPASSNSFWNVIDDAFQSVFTPSTPSKPPSAAEVASIRADSFVGRTVRDAANSPSAPMTDSQYFLELRRLQAAKASPRELATLNQRFIKSTGMSPPVDVPGLRAEVAQDKAGRARQALLNVSSPAVSYPDWFTNANRKLVELTTGASKPVSVGGWFDGWLSPLQTNVYATPAEQKIMEDEGRENLARAKIKNGSTGSSAGIPGVIPVDYLSTANPFSNEVRAGLKTVRNANGTVSTVRTGGAATKPKPGSGWVSWAIGGGIGAALIGVGATVLMKRKKKKTSPNGLTAAQDARWQAMNAEYEGADNATLMGVGLAVATAAGVGAYMLVRKRNKAGLTKRRGR